MEPIPDLTVIMPTPNKVPKEWAEYHKAVLLKAIGDTPIITISKDPLDWGENILQTEYGVENLFRQMLRGAKLARTNYIAIAEDDTLYTREHFLFRPPMDKVAYDMNRWDIFTWGFPFYFHKPHPANGGMVAPRELLIRAIEERFNKYPINIPGGLLKEIGRTDHERRYGVTPVPMHKYYAPYPFLCFKHDYSVDPYQTSHRKVAWPVRAFDIPVWGRAEEIRKKFLCTKTP